MRCIDADVLEKEGWSLHRTVRVDKHTTEYQVKPIAKVPTIEPERKKGKWFWGDGMYSCDQCHAAFYETSPFCPMCGADMRGEQG